MHGAAYLLSLSVSSSCTGISASDPSSNIFHALLKRRKMLKSLFTPRLIRNRCTMIRRSINVETESFVNPQVSTRI
jgi:hypothetical protein